MKAAQKLVIDTSLKSVTLGRRSAAGAIELLLDDGKTRLCSDRWGVLFPQKASLIRQSKPRGLDWLVF